MNIMQSTEHFGAFATTMTSQRISIQSAAPSTAVWRNLKGKFLRSPILGVRGVLEGLEFLQIESPPTTFKYIPMETLVLSAAVWPDYNVK